MPDTNPPVLTQFAMPDPSAAPLNLIQLFQLANVLVHSEIQGSYKPYVIGGVEPGVDDRDKIWFELSPQGQPVAIKYYWHGHWRRVWNGMPGQICGFSGDPGYGAPPKVFDSSGLGNIGGVYDGWAICNGKNGTPDLSDQFIIGAHMNNNDGKEGWDGTKWVTWISNKNAEQKGGVRDFTLTRDTTYIPPLKPGGEFSSDDLIVGKWAADGNARASDGNLYGVPKLTGGVPDPPSGGGENALLINADTGNETPDAVSVIPPFYALAWIIFTGYR